jgi:Tol biopolymer transport system component
MTRDGRTIVFMSDRAEGGTYNIWKMNADGTDQVQVTFGTGEIQPVVTPDSKWIVYTSGGTETPAYKRSIWKVPIGGGEPVQLVPAAAQRPDISPDGKSIVCWYKPDAATPWKTAIFPIDGGPPTKILDLTPESPIKWTPAADAISYVKTIDAVSNIWSQQISGGPPKQLTPFTSGEIINLDWSSDRRLIFSRSEKERDVVLIRNFR